jgi:hypothetical protein
MTMATSLARMHSDEHENSNDNPRSSACIGGNELKDVSEE